MARRNRAQSASESADGPTHHAGPAEPAGCRKAPHRDREDRGDRVADLEPALPASPATWVSPMRPRAPGASSQNPGRKRHVGRDACGSRDTQVATGVITSAPTKALSAGLRRTLPTTWPAALSPAPSWTTKAWRSPRSSRPTLLTPRGAVPSVVAPPDRWHPSRALRPHDTNGFAQRSPGRVHRRRCDGRRWHLFAARRGGRGSGSGRVAVIRYRRCRRACRATRSRSWVSPFPSAAGMLEYVIRGYGTGTSPA